MRYTIQQLRSIFQIKLNSLYSANEIRSFFNIIANHFLGLKPVDINISLNREVSYEVYNKFIDITEQLVLQQPIQYIIGETEFYDRKFFVNPSVLIPRQETEELVNWIINDNTESKKINILDIGTGSGCIPITLKCEMPQSSVYAIDISPEAIMVAKKNSELNNVDINFIERDILASQDVVEDIKFNIIVSNPPYITNTEKLLMEKNVLDHEPHLALFVDDNNPLIFYSAIANYSKNNLVEGGFLYFEINEAFGPETKQMLEQKGFCNVLLRKDINNKNRMIKAQYNG